MTPNRWERILDEKPVPVLEHLLEEVATLFAAELRRWPPEAEFDLTVGGAHWQEVQRREQPPDDRIFRAAFELATFDLDRQFDAYDDYMRNERWRERGLEGTDKGALLFVSRLITEQLFGLGEATHGRLQRPQLREVINRTKRHFFRGAVS